MPWFRGLAPAYLNLFIWAPFFDQLWVNDPARFGLGSLISSAILGSLLCFGLFMAATSWGFNAKKPLLVVAASAFGATGSEWLCGLAVACAAVVWYAIAINFAVESTLLGLRSCGMISPSAVAPWTTAPILCKCPAFLATTLFWIWVTRTAIIWRLYGVVVGLMKVYAPIAVLLLTATALWRVPLLWAAEPNAAGALSASQPPANGSALSMMLGFFAVSALASVDWGAAALSRRDIVRAGLPCVLVAAAWTSLASLLVVFETARWISVQAGPIALGSVDPMPFSFRWAVFQGTETFPPGAAAAILILFGLAALAPAVSSLETFSERFSTHWPNLGPRRATWIACSLATLLMATGQVDRLGPIFRAFGVIFAPVLGAMAADLFRRSQSGSPLRLGINRSGLFAWAAGFSAGALFLVATAIRPDVFSLQLEAICGFIVSACVYAAFSHVYATSPPLQ